EQMMEDLYHLAGFRNNINDDDYWRLMTDEQIKELSTSPWATIGSHGYYHNDLAKIPIDKVKEELIQSKDYLEKVTGKEVKALAFPYGSYNKQVKDEAIRVGYTQLLGTETLLPGDNEETMIRERFTINPFIQVHTQMQATIKGNYAHWK
ncbi:MAG: polysaccharide deacetylase family protein, partial [Chitinophagaceae bacterium]